MPRVRELYIEDSRFKGAIPAGIFKLTKLSYLYLDGNQFHDAPIPNAISNLVNLMYVKRCWP